MSQHWNVLPSQKKKNMYQVKPGRVMDTPLCFQSCLRESVYDHCLTPSIPCCTLERRGEEKEGREGEGGKGGV